MSDAPFVSVIVPTHNRAGRLPRCLDALARVDWPAASLETIVVADGCTDDTPAVIARWHPPFAARLVEQPASGPSVARNRGAAEARGKYLVFVDDDVEVSPAFVRAHVDAHAGVPRQVVIGYLPARVAGSGFFAIALRGWWDSMFQAMWRHGHRFTFRDLLSGNCSMEQELFAAIGGYEAGLRCHEDYELGLRLLAAGARFRFAPAAMGVHDERTTLGGSLRRKFEEGRADVWLLARYPQLHGALPMQYMQADTRRRRLLLSLARHPRAGDALAWLLRQRLPFYEALRLRYRWRALVEDLFFYCYWRGVHAAGGPPGPGALTAAAVGPPLDIDLAFGLEEAERRLEAERPAAVRLRHAGMFVADVPATPGSEPLRGEHLRRLLAEDFVDPYARALALAGDFPPAVDVQHVLAVCRPAVARHADAARASAS